MTLTSKLSTMLVFGLCGVALAAQNIVVNQNKLVKSYGGDTATASINADKCKIKIDGKVDTLNVRGTRNDLVVSGAVGQLVLPGSNNKLTLHAGVASCLLGGNENVLVVTSVAGATAHLEIVGSGNVVTWSKAGNPTPPDWVDNGRKNVLKMVP